MHRLAISMARRINGFLSRAGKGWFGRVFVQRYHSHTLRTPQEMHAALGYVLLNHHKHSHGGTQASPYFVADPFSSAEAFDGFAFTIEISRSFGPPPVHPGRHWLTRAGYRKLGLIRSRPAVPPTYLEPS